MEILTKAFATYQFEVVVHAIPPDLRHEVELTLRLTAQADGITLVAFVLVRKSR